MTTSDPPGHHSLLTMRHDIGTAYLRRPLPAEQPADAFWWRIVGEEARHRSTTPKASRMRGPETPLSREAERLRQVRKQEDADRMLHRPDRPGPSRCVRRRRAQLRAAM